MTTRGAGENHPDTIVISDENEARLPRDKLDNSRPRSRPQTESRYMEVVGVLVESSAKAILLICTASFRSDKDYCFKTEQTKTGNI